MAVFCSFSYLKNNNDISIAHPQVQTQEIGWHVAIFNLRVCIFRVCRIFVENCLSVSRQKCAFLGEMMQNHRNKARRHGVPEFMVIDMGASLAISPIRLS
jgi:hypothetical protein